MSWSYLLIFNDKLGIRSDVTTYLDKISEISYWYTCMPNAIFLTSTLTAGSISDRIKSHFGTDSGQRFFISEVHKDRQGWMPKKVWHMLNNPDNPRMGENE